MSSVKGLSHPTSIKYQLRVRLLRRTSSAGHSYICTSHCQSVRYWAIGHLPIERGAVEVVPTFNEHTDGFGERELHKVSFRLF